MSLETTASWMVIVAAQEQLLAPLAIARGLQRLPSLFSELPLVDLDKRATGAEVAWYRQGLGSYSREEAYWTARDFAAGVGDVEAPVQLMGGWYDIFLPWMLEDFSALHAAGRRTQLIIGPWTHTAPGLLAASLRDGAGWLRAHLLGDERLAPSDAVRVFVTGDKPRGGWRSLETWPPPGCAPPPAVARARPPPGGERADRRSPRRGRALPLRPLRPDTLARRAGAAGARAGDRQPLARVPARRARLHRRAAGRDARGDRAGRASSSGCARARRTSTCSRGCATWTVPACRATCATRSSA